MLLMGKSTISMAIFHSKMLVHQRVKIRYKLIDGYMIVNPPIYVTSNTGNQAWLIFPSEKNLGTSAGRPDTGPVPVPWTWVRSDRMIG